MPLLWRQRSYVQPFRYGIPRSNGQRAKAAKGRVLQGPGLFHRRSAAGDTIAVKSVSQAPSMSSGFATTDM